jgi:hypothetical protein
MKIWASEWYLKTYGKPIPITQEDVDREREDEDERDWYYEKQHRQGLVNAMAAEQVGRR